MNRAAMNRDRENQKRLMEEFHRISDYNALSSNHAILSHSLLDHHSFFSAPSLLSPTDTPSSEADLELDFPDGDPALAYEPIASNDDAHLQVDHNGTEVQLSSPVTWLPSLEDFSVPISVSTSSSVKQSPLPASSNATVAAAAATAAMIVERDDVVQKRPRSPTSGYMLNVSDDIDDDDNLTEASLPEFEDPCSPRSISFAKITLDDHIQPISHRSPPSNTQKVPPSPPKKLGPANVAKHKNSLPEERRLLFSIPIGSPNDVASSKKRRAEAMERFRRKKAVRCYGRRVRYQIRKRIATTRPRVNGRFARRTDPQVAQSQKPERAD